MSLANYLKRYKPAAMEALYGAVKQGPHELGKAPHIPMGRYGPKPELGEGGLLGKGGLAERASDATQDFGEELSQHPYKTLAGGAAAGALAGHVATHEDEDTPGHKVDALLAKLGLA